MADRFEDPRVEGELRELNQKLDRIARNVDEAERAARSAESRTRRTAPEGGRAPGRGPTLDDEYRQAEASRRKAAAEERAARARRESARAAEAEADAARRFEARRSGQRSAAVYDLESGQRQRGFRGAGPSASLAQADALRRAERYAETLNRAADAARRLDLIPHPQLFGRQVYAPTGPYGPGPVERGTAARPPGGVAAAEGRLSRAEIDYERARREYTNVVKRKSATEADVTSARLARQAARDEVAAARANVQATRAQVAARQEEVARLRAMAAQEAAARRQLIVAQQRASAALVAQAGAGGGGRFLPPGGRPPTVPFGTPPPGLPPGAPPPRQLPSGDRAWDEAARAARQRPLRDILGEDGDAARRAGEQYTRAGHQARSYFDSIAYGARAHNLASDSLRRHGALTTEFIEAAARGQTTIRELGYQVAATTAKFAGWTAAAGFIFAALGAIRELGTGAIDTAEGVNALQRIIPQIDTGHAQQELQNLAREFNLPIGDVADAAYGISKVFGSIQNPVEAARQTFAATRAVLFAMKVGELDAATSTRYLTSIIQGFQLTAEDMPLLLDTINQAQNRFGGNVGQITQGVAQAAGAFSSAGGNYRQLIALIQTGSRVTGRTGAEIGTALRRAAEIYQRPERRQTIMDLLGIDPRESTIVEVIERAMKVVRGAAPALQAQVAKAISTPELASGRILPILRSAALYREIQRGIAPGQAQGSAQRELDRALQAPRQALARLRVDLQELGSELAQGGFLTPFVTLVGLLDQSLQTLERMAEIVGDLPGPLRAVAAYGLPAAAAIGAARRFDVGRGSGVLGRAPGARTRANILTGVQAEQDYVLQERTRAVSEMTGAQRRADRLSRQLAALTGEGADIDARRTSLEARRNSLLQQAGDAEDELNDLTRRSAELEDQHRAVRRTRFRSEQEVVRRAQQAGVAYAQPTVDRPFAGAPVPLGGGGGVDDGAAARQAAQQNTRLQQRAQRFNASVSQMGRSGQLLGATATRGAAAAAGAGAALSGSGAALGRMGSGLVAAIGPIDLVIAGLIAYVTLQQLLSEKNDEIDAAVQQMRHAQGPEGLAAQIRRTQEQADSTGTQIAGWFQEIQHVGEGLAISLGSPTRGLDYITQGTDTPGERASRDLATARGRLEDLRAQQERSQRLYQSQIRTRLRARFAGATSDEEREQAIDQARKEYSESLYRHSRALQHRPAARTDAAQTRDLIAQMRGSVAATVQGVDRMAAAIAAIEDAASAERFVTEMQARFRQRGVGRELPRGAAGLQRLRALVANETDAERRAELLQQLTQLQDDILGRLEQRFQRQLASGGDPRRARRRYLSDARMALFGVRTDQELRELEARRRRLQAAIRALRQVISHAEDQLDAIASRYLSGDPHAAEAGPGRRRSSAQGRLRALLGRLDQLGPPAAKEDLGKFGDLQRDSQDAVDNILEEQARSAEERLQQAIALFQARQRLASARALIGATQGARLQRAVSDAQQFLGFIQGQHGADQLQILEAQTAVAEAQDALAQYVREQAQALVRARAELARSRTTDPIKQAEISLREAQQLLAYAETPAERIQGLAEVNNRRRDLQSTQLQERADQQQFLYDLGRLTREQYASWIQRFLRAHGELRRVNRDMFRQLRRTLHQLRTETEQDLDLQVGEIRLPTLYDVRRLVQQGTRTAPNQLVQQNQIDVHPPPGSDPEAIGQAVLQTLTTGGKSGMRAAGLTG